MVAGAEIVFDDVDNADAGLDTDDLAEEAMVGMENVLPHGPRTRKLFKHSEIPALRLQPTLAASEALASGSPRLRLGSMIDGRLMLGGLMLISIDGR